MNDTVQLDQAFVNGLADKCDTAETALRDSAGLLGTDAEAAASGLSGFSLAEQLTATQAAWDRKARACMESVAVFGQALRTTAATLPGRDAANSSDLDRAAEFVFPEDSPILASGPPWDHPDHTQLAD